MHQRFNNLDKQIRILLRRYCGGEVRADPEVLKQMEFYDDLYVFAIYICQQEYYRIWVQNVQIIFLMCKTEALFWFSCAVSEVFLALLIQKGKCNMRDLQKRSSNLVFLKLREYSEGTIFQQYGSPPHLFVLVRHYLR